MKSTPFLWLIFARSALKAHEQGHRRLIGRQVASHMQLPHAHLSFPAVIGTKVVTIVVPGRRRGRGTATELYPLLGAVSAVPLARGASRPGREASALAIRLLPNRVLQAVQKVHGREGAEHGQGEVREVGCHLRVEHSPH